jgi:cation diffusion facilitator family transporter
VVGLAIIGAAIVIAIQSIHQIRIPHQGPASWTLVVLALVIFTKEFLFRRISDIGAKIGSLAVTTDAWHHRADAITSAAAFIGISIALIGGPGYESADDFAALFASVIIAINGLTLIKPALFELIDTAPDPRIARKIRDLAQQVPGVLGTHKCNVRKVGFDHFVDLDILCDPDASIRTGHEIAHKVGELLHSEMPEITKILVHVEPVDDYGRR